MHVVEKLARPNKPVKGASGQKLQPSSSSRFVVYATRVPFWFLDLAPKPVVEDRWPEGGRNTTFTPTPHTMERQSRLFSRMPGGRLPVILYMLKARL